MSRQTFGIVALLLGVWLIGFSALWLAPEPGAGRHEATANDPAPIYRVNARTSSVYQDPSGRYTLFVRNVLREERDAPDDTSPL